jgi:lysophospholipase L1-like esterase
MSARRVYAVAASLVCALAATFALGTAQAAAFKVGNTYLALGDSLAYGFHAKEFKEELALGKVNPETFDQGYVNDFYNLLTLFNPSIKLINDGCPGETTETMIHGSGVPGFCAGGPHGTPFPYAYLHHPYEAASQLEDALKILQKDPDVSPITLDIGANDALQFLAAECGFPKTDSCSEGQLQGEIQKIGENTAFILSQLRHAAPHATIIMVGLYNPFPEVPSEGSDRLTAALNIAFEKAVQAVPGVSFANPMPLFNPSLFLGLPESFDIPVICAFTAMCPGGTYNPASPEADIHPTNLGYEVMAGVVAFDFLTH